MSLLDILFPKKCVVCRKMGEYLCPNCFSQLSFDTNPKCLVCERPSWDGMTHPACQGKYTIDGYFCAVSYKRVAKKLLYKFKYKPYLSDLQTVITDLLYENLVQDENFIKMLQTNPLFIPIPLFTSKLRKRGYNQAELLATNLGKRFELQVVNCLIRIKETRPQYGLKREERIENMKNAFAFQKTQKTLKTRNSESLSVRKSGILSFPSIQKTAILVDDVVTTGSTLKEAANILKRSGFKKVWAVTFAQD